MVIIHARPESGALTIEELCNAYTLIVLVNFAETWAELLISRT